MESAPVETHAPRFTLQFHLNENFDSLDVWRAGRKIDPPKVDGSAWAISDLDLIPDVRQERLGKVVTASNDGSRLLRRTAQHP